jgi:hypothetical protein
MAKPPWKQPVDAFPQATKADSCPFCCHNAKANDGPLCRLCDDRHADGHRRELKERA